VELQQVRYFLALARTLNFTRAAEECNVTQPALTKSIQRLEELLDGQLIYRQRGKTQLTPFGRLMLPLLEQTFSAATAAKAQALMFRRQDRATLRLGTALELGTGFLVPVLQELHRRLTSLELAWRREGRNTLIGMLVDGTLDVAILAEPERLPDHLHRWVLFSERYVVTCPIDHALAARTEIPHEILTSERLLLHDRTDCEYRSALRGLGLGEAEETRISHLACSEEQIDQLVLSGFGLGLATESRVLPAGLVARPIAPPSPRRIVLLVAPAQHRRPIAADGFIKLLRAQKLGAVLCDAKPVS
jgi:DNA-binding transcriptional LysR family regulator